MPVTKTYHEIAISMAKLQTSVFEKAQADCAQLINQLNMAVAEGKVPVSRDVLMVRKMWQAHLIKPETLRSMNSAEISDVIDLIYGIEEFSAVRWVNK